MSRRAFFKSILGKVKDTAHEVAKETIKEKLKRKFLRPPGAISEEHFLLTCTRCGDCKTACPYDAVHLMGLDGGVHTNTPFVDPQYSACRYCEDMPCVTSCKPKALRPSHLKMGEARFYKEHCLVNQGQRCDYCFKSCPDGIGAISKDENSMPAIDTEKCVGCGKCEYICVSMSGRALLVSVDIKWPEITEE